MKMMRGSRYYRPISGPLKPGKAWARRACQRLCRNLPWHLPKKMGATRAPIFDSCPLFSFDAENGNRVSQVSRLLFQARSGGRALLHQCRVLLRHLVELVHSGVHLSNAIALL
jgi:hypothetical protein